MVDAPDTGERHMSDAEALMWTLEKDPLLRATFANITILDRPVDEARLRSRLERVVQVFPRLRRKVAPTFGRLAPPRWVDDVDFDLDAHIRRVAVGGSGSRRDLLDAAAPLIADPFDRARPLWRFWIVDGIAGGGGALIQQLHHTITDGEGGVRLSAMLLDLERDALQPIMPLPDPDGPQPPADDAAAGSRPAVLAGLTAAVTHNARRQLGLARRGGRQLVSTALHPHRLPELAGGALAVTASLARQMSADEARSPLWRTRSLSRHLEALSVPLDDARDAAKQLGGTINDFFVTGVAAAAGEYHRQLDHPVDELRLSMPVSIRSDRAVGGNAFTPARLLVPTGPMFPPERFRTIHERLSATKGEPGLRAVESLAGVLNLLPTSLLVELGRRQVRTVDFAVSNVRGAPFDLYLAGARVEANFPVGPTGGTAFNLTLLSSGGKLDMGLNVDVGAVAQPERLRECLELAFGELLQAG